MTPQTTPSQTDAPEEARVPVHKRPHESDSSLDEVEEIETPSRARMQQRTARTAQATSTAVPISGTVGEPGDSRAERMITEVEHLYNFGVCVGILPEDRDILTALRKMKKRFRSLSLPTSSKGLNRRRSHSETQDSGSGSSEGTSSLSAASLSSKSVYGRD
ncbi:hypothetical protein TrVGV298_000896 [Trichoderma virens]|nr:hypothetical protein TrVGV298_000896 [Trichoderma virens]